MLNVSNSLTLSGPLAIAGPVGGGLKGSTYGECLALACFMQDARAMPGAIMAQSVPKLVHTPLNTPIPVGNTVLSHLCNTLELDWHGYCICKLYANNWGNVPWRILAPLGHFALLHHVCQVNHFT